MLRPDRQQLQWLPRNLDEVLAQDHAARAIWGLLEKMDLSAFYGSIKATVERPGRPTTDPQVAAPPPSTNSWTDRWATSPSEPRPGKKGGAPKRMGREDPAFLQLNGRTS